MPTFTPPVVYDVPAYLPDSTPSEVDLWQFAGNRARGVNVYKLADGTYVQDTPTAENSAVLEVPPVLMPDQERKDLISRTYDAWTATRTDQVIANPVIHTYFGGHSEVVSAAEATALAAAGYGACLT